MVGIGCCFFFFYRVQMKLSALYGLDTVERRYKEGATMTRFSYTKVNPTRENSFFTYLWLSP